MNIKNLFSRPERATRDYAKLSPAERAAATWDKREGEIIQQNYHLRLMLIGFIVAIVALAGALSYRALTENVLVYVVETDIKTGEVRNVGTANQMKNYTPSQQVYNYFIRQFVTDIRSIPLDEVVYSRQLEEAAGYLTTDGANLLQSQLQSENRPQMLGKATVQVTIHSVLPMEGGKSYQVRWSEVTYQSGNGARTVTPYTGVFTVEMIKSDDEKQLAINPLGMYISDFRFEKDSNVEPAQTNTPSEPGTSGSAARASR